MQRSCSRKRALKHSFFFAFSVVVANFFLAYIIGMDQVLRIIREPLHQHVGGFGSMLAFSGMFYFVFARLREQVCTTICPYGRLQGVLLVKESIVVAYDYKRGEPRGKLKRAAHPERPAMPGVRVPDRTDAGRGADPVAQIRHAVGVSAIADREPAVREPGPITMTRTQGDCVDCKLCIHVCPTGIDIRNGTQLECVNCTACIDACDAVMDKIGKPRGLIRYDSMTGIETGRRQLFTPRVLAYTGVLIALIALDVFLFASRGIMETIILRSPGQLYQQRDEIHITNLYTYQLINKSVDELPVELRLKSGAGRIEYVGKAPAAIAKGSKDQGAFFVVLPLEELDGRKTPIVVEVYSNGEQVDEVKTNFMGPKK